MVDRKYFYRWCAAVILWFVAFVVIIVLTPNDARAESSITVVWVIGLALLFRSLWDRWEGA